MELFLNFRYLLALLLPFILAPEIVKWPADHYLNQEEAWEI